MFSNIRFSQIIGLVAIDSATAAHLGKIQDIWVDNTGRIVYLSSAQGYLPLEQVAGVSTQAISTYGHLSIIPEGELRSLQRLAVLSSLNEPIGWIEDFVFDWHTGEITAYILSGNVASAWGDRAVLSPEDIREITGDTATLALGAPARLRSEAEGLQDFLSEKQHQVRQLIHELSDRLREMISPRDRPETVRVKIKTAIDEMADSDRADRHLLQEATDFLLDRWDSLQDYLHRAGIRSQRAMESAWKHLTGKPPRSQ